MEKAASGGTEAARHPQLHRNPPAALAFGVSLPGVPARIPSGPA